MDSVKSVLIIDDDEDDRLLIEDALLAFVSADCLFVSCYDKLEAVTLLKERTFDLCLLDYRLAGYEGIEILEAVSSAELATPIIMLTGQKDDQVAKEAIKNGAQDFVMKSEIDTDIFEKSIQYAIARKELEFAKILSQRKEAQSAAKDKFIAHLSHELRTPLTSILGYTSLLLDNSQAEPFYQELSVISNNGKHLLSLLNDVLDLSKIAANKFELRPVPTNLQQLFAEVNSLVSVNLLDKGLELEFYSKTKLPETMTIDDVRFRQIILNLLSNAIKFTDQGKIMVTLEFNLSPMPLLLITVKDTGIGMEDDQLAKIFSPFTQVEDVANRKAGGAGLGLSICNEIVKQMNGNISAESKLGEGSTFTLCVPCDCPEDDFIDFNFDLQISASEAITAPMLSGKVLVVDDVFEIRQLAGIFVKETGVKVEFAINGKDAITKIESAKSTNAPFDLVFMDLHMPVMTGVDALQHIRQHDESLLVVAMTAAFGKGLYEEMTSKGFNELITKPLNKKEIWQILINKLPAKNPKDSQEGTQLLATSSLSSLSPAANQELNIHLVEDDLDSAMVMQMMLQQLGCSVIHSETAQQALQQAELRKDIDYHLVDLGLPDISGEKFIQAFFTKSPSGQVTILSGREPDNNLMSKYPIQTHLTKPIDKLMLTSWLDSVALGSVIES